MKYEIDLMRPEYAEGCHRVQHSGIHHHHEELWHLEAWKWIAINMRDAWVIKHEGEVIGYFAGMVQFVNEPEDEHYGEGLGFFGADICLDMDPERKYPDAMNQLFAHICDIHPYITGYCSETNQSLINFTDKWGFDRWKTNPDSNLLYCRNYTDNPKAQTLRDKHRINYENIT